MNKWQIIMILEIMILAEFIEKIVTLITLLFERLMNVIFL